MTGDAWYREYNAGTVIEYENKFYMLTDIYIRVSECPRSVVTVSELYFFPNESTEYNYRKHRLCIELQSGNTYGFLYLEGFKTLASVSINGS